MRLADFVSFEFFPKAEQWLEKIRRVKANQTYKNYKVAIEAAKRYQDETGSIWDIDLLDIDFVDGFIQYLLVKYSLLDSTVDKYLNILKNFLIDVYPSYDVSVLNRTKLREKVVWFYAGELLALKDLQVESPWDKIRDLFLFTATTGMRFKDTQRYTSDWLDPSKDPISEYVQLYPGGASHTVLKGTTEEILRAYGGKPPIMAQKEYEDGLRALLHSLKFERPVTFWKTKASKNILLTQPLAFAADADTGRQTYIMNLLISRVPVKEVMEYSNHYSLSSFYPYLDLARRHLNSFSGALPTF